MFNPGAKAPFVPRMIIDTVVPGKVSGMEYLRDPELFKGMAFRREERQTLGIHCLLPPWIKTYILVREN